MVVTKVTARPIETAGLVSLETPIKGHNPKNLERIKLLIKTIEIIRDINLAASIATSPPNLFSALIAQVPIIHQPNQQPHCQKGPRGQDHHYRRLKSLNQAKTQEFPRP